MPIINLSLSRKRNRQKKSSDLNGDKDQQGVLEEIEEEFEKILFLEAHKSLFIGEYFEMEVGIEGDKVKFPPYHKIC